jgi:hypothetical protein
MCCADVAERWNKQYTGLYDKQPDKLIIFDKLTALCGRGTEDQIAEITGNSSWTKNKCYECEKDVDTVIILDGNLDHWDGPYFIVCIPCLQLAIMLGTGTTATNQRRNNYE